MFYTDLCLGYVEGRPLRSSGSEYEGMDRWSVYSHLAKVSGVYRAMYVFIGSFARLFFRIIDNVRGELNKRQWIVFDGDVDPDWVENLNSVLDDNKMLTLPNGERLNLPPNVRIMFEVQDLKYATLATVSRCGMVWFSEEVVTIEMAFEHYLRQLRNVPLDESEEDAAFQALRQTAKKDDDVISPTLLVNKISVHLSCLSFNVDLSLSDPTGLR